ADDRGPDHLLSCARPLPARRRTVCMPGYQHKEGTMNGHIAYQPRGRAWWPRAATAVAATLVTGLLAHQAIAQEVIASATFDVTSPEYVKWNKDTCLFEPAEGKGPYVAEVRKSEKPIRIVFTPEEQTNPVFVAQAKKLVELGKQANVEVTVLD